MEKEKREYISTICVKTSKSNEYCFYFVLLTMSNVLEHVLSITSIVSTAAVLIAILCLKQRKSWPKNITRTYYHLLLSIVFFDFLQAVVVYGALIFSLEGDGPLCIGQGALLVACNVYLLWLMAALSVETLFLLRLDPGYSTAQEVGCYYTLAGKENRQRTIFIAVNVFTLAHIATLFHYPGYGSDLPSPTLCGLRGTAKDKLFTYHWLTTVSTGIVLCIFVYLIVFFCRYFKNEGKKFLCTAIKLCVLPAIVSFFNIPIVLNRISEIEMVPNTFLGLCGNIRGFVISLALVLQNSQIQAMVKRPFVRCRRSISNITFTPPADNGLENEFLAEEGEERSTYASSISSTGTIEADLFSYQQAQSLNMPKYEFSQVKTESPIRPTFLSSDISFDTSIDIFPPNA